MRCLGILSVAMRHLVVAIPYSLAGAFFIFVSAAKESHSAYLQSIICLMVGVCFAFVGIQQLRLWRHP